jgi:hypothetical protein
MMPIVQSVFAESNSLAKPHDGMWQALGVAKKQVEYPTNEQSYAVRHILNFSFFQYLNIS